ncbi:hypothetical protein [Rhodohalobacter sp. 614A]|nr:hypothetical protein [Rhodohalobacter sp. 614A]
MYNVSVEIDFEDDFIPAKHFFKEYPVRLYKDFRQKPEGDPTGRHGSCF